MFWSKKTKTRQIIKLNKTVSKHWLVLLGGKEQVWKLLLDIFSARETSYHFQAHQLEPLLFWYIFLSKSNRTIFSGDLEGIFK